KLEILALSRIDLAEPEQLAESKAALAKAAGVDPLPISAATGEGMEKLLDRIIEKLGPEPQTAGLEEGDERAWSPL
ncbi:MAG TPA: GTPase ObgE, partial [Sphingomicrobium sp.]|nr:GTPase ObgE [Sphingomicrobium sp.]